MEAYFDGTLEGAAQLVANQAVISAQFGGARTKVAFTQPNSVAQGLEFLWNPPTIPAPSGTGTYTDPAWGTIGKGLLGAGLGVGAAGVSSLFNERRRKHWLRNMLLGGLLGGGIGGGLGALYHYGNSLGSGTESTSAQDNYDRIEKANNAVISAGGTLTPAQERAQAEAFAQLPNAAQGQVSPLDQRARSAYYDIANHGVSGMPSAASKIYADTGASAGGAAVGAGAAALANDYRHRRADKAIALWQQQKNEMANKSTGQAIADMPESAWHAAGVADPKGQMRRFQNAPPSENRNATTLEAAFPTLAAENNPHLIGPRPANWEHIPQSRFNKMRQQATHVGPEPLKPRLKNRWAAAGGAILGSLAPLVPQLLSGMSSSGPNQPGGPE